MNASKERRKSIKFTTSGFKNNQIFLKLYAKDVPAVNRGTFK